MKLLTISLNTLFFFLSLLSGGLTFQLHNCLHCMGRNDQHADFFTSTSSTVGFSPLFALKATLTQTFGHQLQL